MLLLSEARNMPLKLVDKKRTLQSCRPNSAVPKANLQTTNSVCMCQAA
jgi:hypothetical protein